MGTARARFRSRAGAIVRPVALGLSLALVAAGCASRGGPETGGSPSGSVTAPVTTVAPTAPATSPSAGSVVGTWRRLPAAPVREIHVPQATWDGSEVLITGWLLADRHGVAQAYDPATGLWRKLSRPPGPRGNFQGRDVAAWDGREMLVLGAGRGLAYDPAANRWRRLPAMRYPREAFAAVCTGSRVLVWGGHLAGTDPEVAPPRGEAFDPAAGTWSPLPISPLRGRDWPAAAWTGRAMVVWGGVLVRDGTLFGDGAALAPKGS